MNLPEEAPKLPTLPFLVGDGVLIATAALIGRFSAAPLGPWPLLAITVCVVAGCALATVPFLVNYARRQDAELAERQNQIAALARTTAESAEQLGIAAASLHGIAESSAGNLKLVEQLPAQLQDRVKDLQKQLADAAKSAAASAKTEASRIDAAAAHIARSVTELSTLEAAVRAHLAGVDEALARLSALAEKTAARTPEAPVPSPAPAAVAETAPAGPSSPRRKRSKPADEETPAVAESPAAETPAPPPVSAPEAAASPSAVVVETETVSSDADEPAKPASTGEKAASSDEPAEAPAAAPESNPEPAPEPAPAAKETPSAPADPSPEEVPVADPPKPRARQPKVVEDPGPDLGLSVEAPENESALSSDGLTRLIATAYIGIGNKLFIRGEGPGLSWDKGVPLQFVSIGKWRWETADATAPLRAKLYKNDQTECTAVGTLTLEPGHQHEVNAGF